jgi:hypothetical protein
MLDVHPAHHAASTWRDFFIHIATIALGLLLAVGLEQSVEALHHRHVLHQLREDLREEDEKALRDNAEVFQTNTALIAWMDQRMALLQDAIRQHKPVPYLPMPKAALHTFTNDPVWQAAKASNLIEVMPQQDIKAYSEIDSLLDDLRHRVASDESPARLSSVERQFIVSPRSPELDFSSATHADLVEELRVLALARHNLSTRRLFNLYIDGALRAVLAGERDLDRINDAEINFAKSPLIQRHAPPINPQKPSERP